MKVQTSQCISSSRLAPRYFKEKTNQYSWSGFTSVRISVFGRWFVRLAFCNASDWGPLPFDNASFVLSNLLKIMSDTTGGEITSWPFTNPICLFVVEKLLIAYLHLFPASRGSSPDERFAQTPLRKRAYLVNASYLSINTSEQNSRQSPWDGWMIIVLLLPVRSGTWGGKLWRA